LYDTGVFMPRYVIGVDLGKTNDYTAVCVIKVSGGYVTYPGNDELFFNPAAKPHISKPHYSLVYLERVERGTSYTKIVSGLKDMIYGGEFGSQRPEELNPLVVDATGVGVAVVDMMREAKLRPISVTITGGDKVTGKEGDFHVPKRDLVSSLVVLFQTRRIVIARDLPAFEGFVTELQNFKVKISESGHDTYEAWRQGNHDDLVLSVAIAAWYAEHIFKLHVPTEQADGGRIEDYVLLGGGGGR
jgi:hypothetical protein